MPENAKFGSQSWMQFFTIIGLSSGQTHSQSCNLYLRELCAQESPDRFLLALFVCHLCSYISCSPDKHSDRAKQLHSQQINPGHISVSYISVSYNAPLTFHAFKTDPRKDTSHKSAPYKLKNLLLRKQAGLHRRALWQQSHQQWKTFPEKERKRGVTRQVHMHFKRCLVLTEQGLRES